MDDGEKRHLTTELKFVLFITVIYPPSGFSCLNSYGLGRGDHAAIRKTDDCCVGKPTMFLIRAQVSEKMILFLIHRRHMVI